MAERCKRCHRILKTPEAIAVGFGSSCYKKIFGAALKRISENKQYIRHRNNPEEHQEIEGQISIFDMESEV